MEVVKRGIIIDGISNDDDGEYVVVYTKTNNKKVKLIAALEKVIDMWNDILYPNP